MVPWNFYIHILDCCTKTLIVCSSFEPRSETRVVLTYLRWSHLCVCVLRRCVGRGQKNHDPQAHGTTACEAEERVALRC